MSDAQYNPAETSRQYYLRRHGELDQEYSSWRTRHEAVMQLFQPYRGRFNAGEQNRGQRKDQVIVNDTPIDSGKKLVSACATSITPASREWLRLGSSETAQGNAYDRRSYLHLVQDLVFEIFAGSNFYRLIPQLYADMIGPATGVMWFEPDAKTVIRFQHFPVGTYRVATNDRGDVDTLSRRFSMTTGQMVKKFGYDACSVTVQREWDEKKYEIWHLVQHTVEPRRSRDRAKIDAKNMPWASCWLEVGNGDGKGEQPGTLGMLKDSGFPIKPFVCGRWEVVGEDAYGQNSPSMQAEGDARALQSLEIAGASSIALINDPPLNIPGNNANASVVPGARNLIPGGPAAAGKIEPTVNIPTAAVTVNQAEKALVERRIQRAHFADLLMFLSNDMRAERATATEIHAQEQERLLQLGGMFEGLSVEVLGPVVNAVLYYGQLSGRIPRPPEDIGKVEVEYLNILVAAQKTIGIQSVRSFAGDVATLATEMQDPSVNDNLDGDEFVRTLADMYGVKPGLVRSDQAVAQRRQQRQQAQAAQQQGAALQQGADSMKTLSQTDPNQLDELLQRYGPFAAASGGTRGV